MPKKLKKPALVLVSILILSTAAGLVYYYWLDDSSKDTTKPYQPSELSVPTDYYAPSVDEIKQQFSNPAEQYGLFIQYAYGKETVKKYDEAIVLYEAAVDVAPDDEQKKATQYTIYLLAVRIQHQELADKYRLILGEEWIAQHEQAQVDRRRDE